MIRCPKGVRLPDGRGGRLNILHISQRPAEAEDRAVAGHWEGDLVFGKHIARSVRSVIACAPNVMASREARTFVASRCPDLPAERLDVVRLLVTELVDNAMWHARAGAILLDLTVDRDRVTVGVSDGGGKVGFAPATTGPRAGMA